MTCPKCKDGLIPFVKNNRVVPGAFIHCSCHPVYGDNPVPERHHHIGLSDFDFPCSDTFRAYSFEYCNQPDPGYTPPEPVEPPPQVKVITKYKYVAPATDKKPAYKDISA